MHRERLGWASCHCSRDGPLGHLQESACGIILVSWFQSICVLPRRSLADQLPDSDAPFVAMPALFTKMKIIRNTSIVNSHVFWHMLQRTKLCSAQTIMAKILGLSLNYGSFYLPPPLVQSWVLSMHISFPLFNSRSPASVSISHLP